MAIVFTRRSGPRRKLNFSRRSKGESERGRRLEWHNGNSDIKYKVKHKVKGRKPIHNNLRQKHHINNCHAVRNARLMLHYR